MVAAEDLYLIVDDEPDMCWAIEQVLKKHGIPSKKALSGQEALRWLESHTFRLAFVDAKLPDMDGLELARRMRENAPAMRILMVSGYFYQDDMAIREALAEGLICGFIEKPFNHGEIMKYIREEL